MNDIYKQQHKPIQNSEKVKYKLGYFYPTNPDKCLTSLNVFRSGWERLFMQWCDLNPNILKWASEPIGIKYLNPIGNLDYCLKQGLDPNNPANWKLCTYYTDFWIEMQDSETGAIKRIFIEVKPDDLVHAPKPLKENATLKEHKAFNRAAETYLINQAKWVAAKKYFEERGAEFMVVTEKTLKKLGLMS